VLFSFNDYIIPSLPFRGFTLKWYAELGHDFVLHDALANSLFIAACTTVVSTLLGTLAAFPLVRCSCPLQGRGAAAGGPADDHSALPDGRGAAAVSSPS
jgi:ABC-type spermidine/putrescine transport system permease subunit II